MTSEPMTSEPIARRRTFIFGKPKPNAVIGRSREPGEILLLLAGGLAGLVCGLAVPLLAVRILGLVGFPLAAVATVYLPFRKRTLYRWFEINRSYHRLLRSGRARWRSAAMEAGTRLHGSEVQIAPPPGIGRVRWATAAFGADEVAVLLHLDRHWITATVEIEGPGVGSRDSEDQEALVARFGALLQHVANGDGFVTRLQMIARTLPADPDAHARDVAERGNPDAPSWLRDSYDELLHVVSTSSEQHRNYLTAAIPYSKEVAAEALALGGGDAGIAALIARELTDIAARLADADIKVRQPLDVSRLSSLFHSIYDPDHPIDATNAMTRRNAWPAEVDATAVTELRSKTRESERPEPWCHATAWVKEWPLTPVGVNFLAPLLVHTPDVIRTFAVVMDLEPTDVAIERMLSEKTNDTADTARAAKLGRITDPRDRAHTSRVDQRGEDLAAGHGGEVSPATSPSRPAPRNSSPGTSARSVPPPVKAI